MIESAYKVAVATVRYSEIPVITGRISVGEALKGL
jgi:hypothetical protein